MCYFCKYKKLLSKNNRYDINKLMYFQKINKRRKLLMKIKKLLFIIMCLALLLLPSTVLAANKVEDYTDFNGNEYELFDDNTARMTKIAIGTEENYGKGSSIHGEVNGSDEKTYKVTSISADALDHITEKQDLYVHPTTAPKLETTNPEEFFKNINAIYVPLAVSYDPEFNAKGYTEANGWPKAKLKNYVITEQPKAFTEVIAGEITTSHKLSVRFTMPVSAGSLVYEWYYCDKDGEIIDKENCISNEPDLQIPTDLAYDNENNTSKDYYFRCIVGDPVNIQEYSDVAKVTVKPGSYKISFYFGNFLPEEQDAPKPIVLAVNSERKLSATDISKIPTGAELEQYKKDAMFAGWTPDGGETILDIDELSTMTFDKNMDLYPVWKTKVNIDATGSGEGIAEQEPEVVPEPDFGEKDDTPKTGNNLPLIENTLFIALISISIFAIIKLRKKVK